VQRAACTAPARTGSAADGSKIVGWVEVTDRVPYTADYLLYAS
jgi:hypothetical protein